MITEASQREVLKLQTRLLQLLERTEAMESFTARALQQFDTLKDGPLNSGDTALMIACTALVVGMSVPAVGLYYAGMIPVTHVLAAVTQAFSICCVITVLWMLVGYSLALGPPGQGSLPVQANQHSSLYYGDASRLWYFGLGLGSVHQAAPTIPESVYATYQLAFAILTACLVTGSFANKMQFHSMLVFIALWHIAVYCPVAHASWHPDGFLYRAGVMDFAGGNVVHICSGCAGTVAMAVLGIQKGERRARKLLEPHNVLLTFIGASFLWVGWLAFNGGSALKADAQSTMACWNTLLASSMSALSWMLVERVATREGTALGMISGAVAGLVAVTPAAGWVNQTGAFFIGLLAGPWCYLCADCKRRAGLDDALDAFGVHATGGVLGGLLTGFFADPTFYGPYASPSVQYYPGVFYAVGHPDQATQLGAQAYGCFATVLYSTVATYVLLLLVDVTLGLRMPDELLTHDLDSPLYDNE